MKKLLASIVAVAVSLFAVSANTIVPAPKSYTKQEGIFTIAPSAIIAYNTEALAPLANYLSEYVKVAVKMQDKGAISLSLDNALAVEAYRLSVTTEGVKIVAGGYGGAFNGVQTLLQLLPSDVYKKSLSLPVAVECCEVDDAPRFPFRGFMLDVSRTFMEKENVLRYIDYLAYHKINKFHWHLTDGQGWRLEIKSRPELTEKGAFRGPGELLGASLGKWYDKYGGYYTQEDIKEVVAYAAVRNVEIIPEIDLPGHSWAFTRVYANATCPHKNGKPRHGGGAICPTNEENFEILEDVFREVAELFPSQYIHIGGDEVNFGAWKACPSCSAWINEHGGGDPRKLQIHFMRRIQDMIAKYDKSPVMWYFGGEMLEGSIVQGWQRASQSKLAADNGYHTVIMPADSFYLDIYQGEHEKGFRSRPPFDVKHLYSFDLAKEGFTPDNMKYVDGFEAPFWSEIFLCQGGDKSLDYIDYMCFPRLCGLAEQGWGKNGGAWENFYATLVNHHYDRMSAMGINYRLMPPTVKCENGKLVASVDDKSTLYYKREGDVKSKKYVAPIACKNPAEYIFWSEYGGIKSFVVADASHYATIKPKYTLTSSVKENKKAKFAQAESYDKPTIAGATVNKGDWYLYEFDEPIKCRAIEFRTGATTMHKWTIHKGYLEVSKNGREFERVGDLHNGRIRLVNPGPIKAARIVSEADGISGARVWAPFVYPKR